MRLRRACQAPRCMEKSPPVKDGRELDAAARAEGWHVCKTETLCPAHADKEHLCTPAAPPLRRVSVHG